MNHAFFGVGIVKAAGQHFRVSILKQCLNNCSRASAGKSQLVAQWLGWYPLYDTALCHQLLILHDAGELTEF